MSDTNIEWTDKVWNPTRGCSRISPGCLHCYAEKIAARFSLPQSKRTGSGVLVDGSGYVDYKEKPGAFNGFAEFRIIGGKREAHWTGKVELIEEKLLEPLSWRKPCRCFVNSMSDLFHADLPDEARDRVFAVMALCPHVTFQVLTKRADVMERYFQFVADKAFPNTSTLYARILRHADPIRRSRPRMMSVPISDPVKWPLRNVWLGVSVENQEQADKRIPHLLRTPAAVRFLSCEPLLGPLNLSQSVGCGYYCDKDSLDISGHHDHGFLTPKHNGGISWCIVGGESGPGARPCNLEWIRNIVRQCKAAGVPCFVKQLGSNPEEVVTAPRDGHRWNRRIVLKDKKGGDMSKWPEDIRIREFPEVR